MTKQPITQDAIEQALEPMRTQAARSFQNIIRSQFDAITEDLGNKLKGVYNNWKWARTFRTTLSPFVGRNDDRSVFLREDVLEAAAQDYAARAMQECAAKIQSKLGELDEAELVAGQGAAYFMVAGKRQGRSVLIEQQMIINVSKLGKLFNQWPARIYLDGKLISEAAYKKL